MSAVPNEGTYWVEPHRLLAGRYPGHPDDGEARKRIRAFLEIGIRTFVNLMFEDEVGHDGKLFHPYAPIVASEARALDVEAQFHRLPIRDVSIPTLERMDEIQHVVRTSLERGAPVYVHCWGGRGRTGQVVGIRLIELGLATPDTFVDVIDTLRAAVPNRGLSPETSEQVDFVNEYVRARVHEVDRTRTRG